MKNRVIFVIASLAVLAWGCSNEREQINDLESVVADVVEEPTVTLEFQADFDKTKTNLDDNSVVWEQGDKIVLFPVTYYDPSFADFDTWIAWKNETGSIKYRATTTTFGYLSDELSVGGRNATFTFTVSASDAEKIAGADYYVAFVYVPGSSVADYAFREDRKFNNSSAIAASSLSLFYYPFVYSQDNVFYHYAYAKNSGGSSLSFKNLHPVLKFTTNLANAYKAIITDKEDEDNYISGSHGSCRRDGLTYSVLDPGSSGAAYTTYSYIEKRIVPGEPTYLTLHSYYSFPNGFVIKILNSSDEVIKCFVYSSAFSPTVGHITTITNFDDRLSNP